MMQLKQTTIASRSSALRAPAVRSVTPRRSVVVRAADEPKPADGTVFYGGKSYTESEFAAARAAGTVSAAPSAPATPAAKQVGFGDVMAFSGIGPELINGRLAMIGFVAALGAELSSGEPVLRQWAAEPTGIAVAFLLVIAGSLVPFLQGNKNTEAFGALTPSAEMNNGRAAMIGFASLLIVEFATSGKALF
ncbi:hypothetical protein FOA52_003899 [Chlamydomonas sp. UWO 241]|nr:hypothetical protein FOA52_003899 [Chlamydomonas sp. UWO 241]